MRCGESRARHFPTAVLSVVAGICGPDTDKGWVLEEDSLCSLEVLARAPHPTAGVNSGRD